MGLTSGAVTTFVFGLSPNFGVALGIRLAAGYFIFILFSFFSKDLQMEITRYPSL
jgi:hypothetical protein